MNTFSWGPHIEKIRLKLSRALGIMNRLKRFFPQKILLTIYHSLFLSHINYQILNWGHLHKNIFSLQKKAVRIISKSYYLEHSEPIFQSLKLLKLEDIYRKSQLRFFQKLKNDQIPLYFKNDFCYRTGQHQHHYPTAASHLFLVPFRRKDWAKNVLRITLPAFINSLGEDMKTKLYTLSWKSFSGYYKYTRINTYNKICTDANCYVCQRRR